MKLLANILLFLTVVALSACVSEEGTQKHINKGSATTKVGVMPGMMWKAVVYDTNAKKSLELGYFESRNECHDATLSHASKRKKTKKGHTASACVIVESDS